MAKDVFEQYCDLEQSLPKTTILKRNIIPNGYTTSPIKKIGIEIRNINNNSPIVIDDDDDVEIIEESGFPGFSKSNIVSNGASFQLAVLREVEFNISDADKANVENTSVEVKRRRGRPKGYVMKKKEPAPETNTKSSTESDDSCEKKNFSLRLGFLGRYQKHKSKNKREKLSRDSTDDNCSPVPKKRSGRPLNINIDYVANENSLANSVMETISIRNSSEEIFPINNKIKDISTPDENVSDSKNEKDDKELPSENVINIKPISLQPRRRMGRPKGPPKSPKIKGKRGRKPKSPSLKQFKSDSAEENFEPKTPGKRGRPKIYPERPPRIKIPGRKVGRPPGPPKPFKPKGPRGRPRLIKINTSDRPHTNILNEIQKHTTFPDKLKFIENKVKNVEAKLNKFENKRLCQIKKENGIHIKSEIDLPKKKRGRPLGYSPIGKTKKRLGRPPQNFITHTNFNTFKLKRVGVKNSKGRGGKRGRPRKISKLDLKIEEMFSTTETYGMENPSLDIKSEKIEPGNEDDDDECSDISVTDKNWETVVEDSQNDDSEIGSIIKQDNDEEDDDNNSDV